MDRNPHRAFSKARANCKLCVACHMPAGLTCLQSMCKRCCKVPYVQFCAWRLCIPEDDFFGVRGYGTFLKLVLIAELRWGSKTFKAISKPINLGGPILVYSQFSRSFTILVWFFYSISFYFFIFKIIARLSCFSRSCWSFLSWAGFFSSDKFDSFDSLCLYLL